MEGSAGDRAVSEQTPTRIYEKDRATFERLRALPMDQLLKQPLSALPLAVRAAAYCAKRNIATIGQLAQSKKSEMLKARNMGRRTVQHIEAYLGHLGLGLDGKLAASVPAPMPSSFRRGATAMRVSIIAHLVAADMPHELVTLVSKIPIPDEEEA